MIDFRRKMLYDIIDKEAIYTKRISLCLIAVIFLVSLFTPVYASNENRIGIIVYFSCTIFCKKYRFMRNNKGIF